MQQFGLNEPGALGQTLGDLERRAVLSTAARLAKRGHLKALPRPARRLAALLDDACFDLDEVRDVFEMAPLLTAQVLRLANSSLFARQGPCHRIQPAILRLGARTLRTMVLAVAVREVFRDPQGVCGGVALHCNAVARITRLLPRFGLRDIPEMFLIGLLHDVGKLLLLQSGEFEYDTGHRVERSAHVQERAALVFDHAALGSLSIRYWGIPTEVADAVGHHHMTGIALRTGGVLAECVSQLELASRLEAQWAISTTPDRRILERWSALPTVQYLGLTPSDLCDLWDLLCLDLGAHPSVVEPTAGRLNVLSCV